MLCNAFRLLKSFEIVKFSRVSSSWNSLLTEMPKEETHLKDIRVKRSAKRKLNSSKIPATVHFQVIGCGTPGGPQSLFLYTDFARYMFNCGESTQRLCTEHSSHNALGQLSQIFITARSWRNLGGLPGMCLSIRGAGAPDVTVHGPTKCMELYDATRNFIVLHDFSLTGHTPEDPDYEDGGLKVTHVELDVENGQGLMPTTPKYSQWIPEPKWKGPPTEMGPLEPIDQKVVAYILTFKPKPAELMIRACLDLGVPPGPLLGELKVGKDVTLADGTVVKAADVLGAEDVPVTYIVVECPSAHYLKSLLNEERLQPSHPDMNNIQGIFHFTPSHIVNNDEYVKWVNSFPVGTQNIMVNDNSQGYGSMDFLTYNKKLNMICPEVFPLVLPNDPSDPEFPSSSDAAGKYPKIERDIVQPSTGQKLHVRPSKNTWENILFKVNESEVEESVNEIQETTDSIESVRQKVAEVKSQWETEPEFPRVTFLGTGSSVPSKYRCVSAILVQNEQDKYFMMDCGEGAILQLHKQYGQEKAQEVLRQLTGIYISHLHADHHLGLIHIVQHREKAFEAVGMPVAKLFILAPAKIAHYLQTYHRQFESVLDNLVQIKNENLLCNSPPGSLGSGLKTQSLFPHSKKDLLETMAMKSILTCRATHCPASFCVAFTTKDGYKMLYTGDTRPNKALIELGKEEQLTDLLIHEATMEHHMLADCEMKKHSTFTEAIRDARLMDAKMTILTHFSQRYSKLPVLDEVEVDGDHVAVAFDGMSVNPRTVRLVRHTYPALRKVFWEEVDRMDEQKAQYNNKFHVVAAAMAAPEHGAEGEDLRYPTPVTKKKKFSDLMQ